MTVLDHCLSYLIFSRTQLLRQRNEGAEGPESQFKCRQALICSYVVNLIAFLFLLSSTIFFVRSFAGSVNGSGSAQQKGLLSWMGTAVFVPFILAYVTNMSTRFVAFALIVSLTLNLAEVYNDFCKSLEETLLRKDGEESELSDFLQKRFARLKWMCAETERILGLLLLITILSSGLMLVMAIYNLLASSGTYWELHLVTGTEQIVYLSLIFFGSAIARLVSEN